MDQGEFEWNGKTLKRARQEYWESVRDGTSCPCCDRYGRVYRRAFNSGMAWWLIRFYRHCKKQTEIFIDVRTLEGGGIELAHKCEFEKLAYWGLIKKMEVEKEEGHASGFWRITEAGKLFTEGKSTVLSHALDYNGGCLKLEGEPVTIRQVLRKKFDYDELMNG